MTFRNKIGLFYLLACCLLFSCHTPREDIGRIVGSTIVFPRQLITVSIGDDTSVPDTLALIKLVTYIDSDGCDDCSLKILRTWRGFVAEMDSVPSNIECVFIFAPKRIENLKSGLHVHRFDLPVFYDPDGAFERANPQLPANPLFHTFLLDRDNRVVLVGSPIGNPKMWELYKSTIDRLVENGGILPKRDTYDTNCKYVCRDMIVKSFGQQKYHY